MPVFQTRTISHGGRTFVIKAETYDDPSYLEASIYEDERPVAIAYEGGRSGFPVYGATFAEPVGEDHVAAAEDLMSVVEADFRRRRLI